MPKFKLAIEALQNRLSEAEEDLYKTVYKAEIVGLDYNFGNMTCREWIKADKEKVEAIKKELEELKELSKDEG
jgi:uncharacterized protein YwgA